MAQLVAHLLCKQGVRGSSPLGSTAGQRPFPLVGEGLCRVRSPEMDCSDQVLLHCRRGGPAVCRREAGRTRDLEPKCSICGSGCAWVGSAASGIALEENAELCKNRGVAGSIEVRTGSELQDFLPDDRAWGSRHFPD